MEWTLQFEVEHSWSEAHGEPTGRVGWHVGPLFPSEVEMVSLVEQYRVGVEEVEQSSRETMSVNSDLEMASPRGGIKKVSS